MKAILFAASAIALIAAAPAYAAEGEILLGGNVVAQCGTGNHLSGAESAPGWDQSDITVTLADGNGQFSGATFTNRSFGNVWCNAPATVTLSVKALTTSATTTDTTSFTNRFDVRVVTDAGVYAGGTQDQVITTVGQGTGIASLTGNSGQAFETGLQRFGGADSIEVLADAGGTGGNDRRALAGTYSGYVRFTATVS